MSRFRQLHLATALVLVLSLLLPAPDALSQVTQGATMTVVRGQVAVIRPDGSAVQPAPSGTFVVEGDEIRTLKPGTALITFFSGIEIELGEDTIITISEIEQEGSRVNVSVSQVFGTTVSRIQGLTDPSSSYRVETGGAVAVIRGSTIAMRGPEDTPNGMFAAAVCIDCGDEDYLEDLGEGDEEEIEEEPAAFSDPDGRVSLARLSMLAPGTDTSVVFQDAFWQAHGLGQTADDGTVNAVMAARNERVKLGSTFKERGTGYVWTVAKTRRGSRFVILKRTLANGRVITKRIRRSVFFKASRFRPIKVRANVDPVESAAEGIGDAAREEQDVENPGTTPAGQGTKKEPKDEDDNTRVEPPFEIVPSHGGPPAITTVPIGVRATTTAFVSCAIATSGPCIAQVTTNDGLAPAPTGVLNFTTTDPGGFFSPHGPGGPTTATCTLTPFPPPPNRSSCDVLYFAGAAGATITATYPGVPGEFGPSSASIALP